MTYTIRQAAREDIPVLARCLRLADQQEIEAHGHEPLEALYRGYDTGPSWVGVDEHGPWGIFGVSPWVDFNPSWGVPWMLTTGRMRHHSRQFLRESRAHRKLLQEGYDTLLNIVDARNTDHIRWIKWAGFEVASEPFIYGPFDMPFYQFWSHANV